MCRKYISWWNWQNFYCCRNKKILDQQNIKSCFIKKKYSDQIDEQKILDKYGQIFINKSRIEALKRAKLENFKVAIFDDGLQDKNLTYDLSFVCFNKKILLAMEE